MFLLNYSLKRKEKATVMTNDSNKSYGDMKNIHAKHKDDKWVEAEDSQDIQVQCDLAKIFVYFSLSDWVFEVLSKQNIGSGNEVNVSANVLVSGPPPPPSV